MVTGLLRNVVLPNVVTKERDPAVADRVKMKDREMNTDTTVLRNCSGLQKKSIPGGRRVFTSGLEAWKQLCRVFVPWVSSRFQWMQQAPLLSTRSDSSVREHQLPSGIRTSENAELAVLQSYLCNGEPTRQPDLQSGSPTMMCDLACDEIAEHTRAASEVVWSVRGNGEGGKKSQDGTKVPRRRSRRNASVV